MPGLTFIHYGLKLLGIIFIFICIGTAVGGLIGLSIEWWDE